MLQENRTSSPARSPSRLPELLSGDLLRQVAEDAVLDGADRGLDARLAGHQDDRHLEIVGAHRLEELDPGHLGHRDVADDHVERARSDTCGGLLAVWRGFHDDALEREDGPVRANERRIVVYEEHMKLVSFGHRGEPPQWLIMDTSESLRKESEGRKARLYRINVDKARAVTPGFGPPSSRRTAQSIRGPLQPGRRIRGPSRGFLQHAPERRESSAPAPRPR